MNTAKRHAVQAEMMTGLVQFIRTQIEEEWVAMRYHTEGVMDDVPPEMWPEHTPSALIEAHASLGVIGHDLNNFASAIFHEGQ